VGIEPTVAKIQIPTGLICGPEYPSRATERACGGRLSTSSPPEPLERRDGRGLGPNRAGSFDRYAL
jgi:hypothetical protein